MIRLQPFRRFRRFFSNTPPSPSPSPSPPEDLAVRLRILEKKVAEQEDNIAVLSITGTGLIFMSLLMAFPREPKRQ